MCISWGGVGDGQGCLGCCSPWGHNESDATERLNWRWNQDPVPRLHYCFLAAPPLSLHPVPSVINSSSLNLSFGIHGRSWRLESIPYRQETAGEEGRKASVARSPTGSCFVSGGRWKNRTENVGKRIPRRESVPNVGINPQQKRGEWGERWAGRQPSEGRAAIIPVRKWRRQEKGLQAPQRLWGAEKKGKRSLESTDNFFLWRRKRSSSFSQPRADMRVGVLLTDNQIISLSLWPVTTCVWKSCPREMPSRTQKGKFSGALPPWAASWMLTLTKKLSETLSHTREQGSVVGRLLSKHSVVRIWMRKDIQLEWDGTGISSCLKNIKVLVREETQGHIQVFPICQWNVITDELVRSFISNSPTI